MAKEKTSLEKSHSKWSNFKLTLLCLLTALFTSLTIAALALFINSIIITSIAFVIIPGVLAILCYVLLNVFTR